MKAFTYQMVGVAPRYAEAAASLSRPGDCAVVERAGTQRQLVMCCPDSCGEILSINLDPRTGPAWRLYKGKGAWSLFPSIDKSTGCLSHFILWRGRVLWCEPQQGDGLMPDFPEISPTRILAATSRDPAGFVQIADKLDEVPWDVLAACRKLVREGLLKEGAEQLRGTFWRTCDL